MCVSACCAGWREGAFGGNPLLGEPVPLLRSPAPLPHHHHRSRRSNRNPRLKPRRFGVLRSRMEMSVRMPEPDPAQVITSPPHSHAQVRGCLRTIHVWPPRRGEKNRNHRAQILASIPDLPTQRHTRPGLKAEEKKHPPLGKQNVYLEISVLRWIKSAPPFSPGWVPSPSLPLPPGAFPPPFTSHPF